MLASTGPAPLAEAEANEAVVNVVLVVVLATAMAAARVGSRRELQENGDVRRQLARTVPNVAGRRQYIPVVPFCRRDTDVAAP